MTTLLFFFFVFLYTVTTLTFPPLTASGATSSCRTFCGNIPINYPFGIDEGCGSPQFKGMLNCSTDLFFITPSGGYKVQRIDYQKNKMVVFDPAMSTCSILQPHHDFKLSDIQNAVVRPSYDTVFALLNCSTNSPVFNRYRNLCFNASGHSCDELYSSCTSFRIFNTTSPSGNSTVHTTPYCCFTSYDTVRVMSMNILDCSHYTTVIDGGNMRDATTTPLDWSYGIELSYSVPEIGCDRCRKSGGICGFDAETEIFLCQCPASNNNPIASNNNPTRECGGGMTDRGGCNSTNNNYTTLLLAMLMSFLYVIL
ncbi:hypothetical protein EUTSA_v10021189mg [Eutrema salsugineum]|uniref:non-specific serine/threonine protein kinase n=1 Tax=Eutrema salsugineum TaxID=72664 RepID=V4M775_EUTSA|nr:wall-associated receptor kinase 2 [Eutrema salsugineum]ESQ48193.1 hypothetical protein EUTSA_v10021189mg [Eutrema salsugineum]